MKLLGLGMGGAEHLTLCLFRIASRGVYHASGVGAGLSKLLCKLGFVLLKLRLGLFALGKSRVYPRPARVHKAQDGFEQYLVQQEHKQEEADNSQYELRYADLKSYYI